MRPTQFLRLREVEHHITLHALIHSYAKLSNADVMSIKLIVVGVTTTTAEAFIRDILRSSKIPSNILALGMDSDVQDAKGCDHADYCFFLPDLAAVNEGIFKSLVATVLHNTKGDRLKFMLHEKLVDSFHNTMYHLWLESFISASVMTEAEWRESVLPFRPADECHHISYRKIAAGETLPAIKLHDSVFIEQEFRVMAPAAILRLLATDSKAAYVIHPIVARNLFVHITYGHDADSFVLDH